MCLRVRLEAEPHTLGACLRNEDTAPITESTGSVQSRSGRPSSPSLSALSRRIGVSGDDRDRRPARRQDRHRSLRRLLLSLRAGAGDGDRVRVDRVAPGLQNLPAAGVSYRDERHRRTGDRAVSMPRAPGGSLGVPSARRPLAAQFVTLVWIGPRDFVLSRFRGLPSLGFAQGGGSRRPAVRRTIEPLS